MPRVFLADAQFEERSALHLVLVDLNMEVVGEAGDWPSTLAQAPATCLVMLLVDWLLLPAGLGVQSLTELRLACPNPIVIVLINYLDGCHRFALPAGVDAFIGKGETSERVVERLRAIAGSLENI